MIIAAVFAIGDLTVISFPSIVNSFKDGNEVSSSFITPSYNAGTGIDAINIEYV